ncbi:hypothetical protein EYF80_029569 [Liparis tanakae]|uniref:Uncharacterized protein n=1 Tax=Liparis tanakae TaxID=230148 RepID=A0A4Z2H5W6_9TELE|nr:hypothetical protein EYF80_029569 [Liparis tanakae]
MTAFWMCTSSRRSAIFLIVSSSREAMNSGVTVKRLRLKYLPDEPLGVVHGVLRVAVGQLHGFVSGQHRGGGERHGARDALPPLFVRDHLHVAAARVKHADRAERGAQIQADHFGFRGRQVLLAQSSLGVALTCVAAFSSGEELAPVLGVFDVQLDQVFLLQVLQVVHRLVAVEQQGRGVLLRHKCGLH